MDPRRRNACPDASREGLSVLAAQGFRFDPREPSGALVDLVTLAPLLLGVIAVAGLAAVALDPFVGLLAGAVAEAGRVMVVRALLR